jgi:hypothetical protein
MKQKASPWGEKKINETDKTSRQDNQRKKEARHGDALGRHGKFQVCLGYIVRS